MKRLFPLLLALSTLVACKNEADSNEADLAAAPPSYGDCTADGTTATDVDGRVLATPDALIRGEMAVHACDSTSPTGDRWWLVKGIKTGKDANRQDGLLVDSSNNVLNVSALSGHTPTSQKRVSGTRFTAACHDISSSGDGCKVVKAVEETTATDTVTITVPKGTKVVVGN